MVKRKRVLPPSSEDGDESQGVQVDNSHFDTTSIIDRNGDLNLIFINDDGAKKKMVVSRHVLCIGSKVFDAMLGPDSHFREATNPSLSTDGVRQINCEDDDFDAMTIITNVLHLQHQRVPKSTTFELLYKIAIVCDKYDLVRSMGLWPGYWAEQFTTQIEKRGFEGWLLIATVFKQAAAFKRITKHLILTSMLDATTDELLTEDGCSFAECVPGAVIGKSELGRQLTKAYTTRCRQVEKLQSASSLHPSRLLLAKVSLT